jgi:hypothetical protein
MIEKDVKVANIIEKCKKFGINIFFKDRFKFDERFESVVSFSDIDKGIQVAMLN